MSDAGETHEPRGGEEPVEVIEVVTSDVDSEGNTIVDDTVLVIDAGGAVIGKDETITFETPEGDIIVSVLGDDGEMHLLDPDAQDPAAGPATSVD